MENIEQAQSQTAPSAPPQEDVPVTLTPKAVQMVKITRDQEGIDPSHGLRVAVRGGGCSGFEYALDFENEARVPGAAARRWRMASPRGRPRAGDSTTVVAAPASRPSCRSGVPGAGAGPSKTRPRRVFCTPPR